MSFRITSLRNVLDAAVATPWAILPEKLDVIADVLTLRVSDTPLTAEELAARVGEGTKPAPSRMAGSVAIIPLAGTLFPKANTMTNLSGGASVQQFVEQVRAAVDNPDVSAVVLDVDSPGGAATGVPEAADALYALRGRKPIVAVANHLMASGAYWLAAQADSIVAAPSADLGSVGVYAMHVDYSRALENEGVKTTLVRAGRFKAEGHPYQPLSPEALADRQARVDEVHDQFVAALARGRNVSPATVRAQYGEGRVLSATKAVAAGMADRVATLDQVVAELNAKAPKASGGRRADAGLPLAPTALGGATVLLGAVVSTAPTASPLVLASDPSAGSADACDPSGTEPAPQAEETTVSTTLTPAPSGAATQDDRAARLAELVALRPEAASQLAGWITNGTSVDAARAELLAAVPVPTPAVSVSAPRETQAPWESFGAFAAAVVKAGMPNARQADLDPRLFAAATGLNQGVGSEGGFTVPAQYSTNIWMGLFDDPTSLLNLCDTYEVEGEFIEFPAVDETTRASANGVYGGVNAYWINEADQATKSKPKFRKMRLEPQEIAALVYLTEKLLNNSPAPLGQYVDRMARAAIAFEVNKAIVAGNGVGKPKGITGSGCKVAVAKETNQAAATINQENISKMWARLPAMVKQRAIWLHNVDVEPALDTLSTVVKNVAGSENVGGYANKVFDPERRTLKGRPLIANDACETLGTEGDLILLDPKAYAVGLRRGGVKTAQSMHVRFEYAEMAFRFMFDVDGQSWLNSALTPFKGANALSPIVTLATRA